MEESRYISKARRGFSLAEVLAAMMIGSMVLIAVLTVYGRAERSAAAVTQSLTVSRRPYEALQLIAEDLDKMLSNDSDTNIVIVNRYVNNYPAAIFMIQVNYKDSANKDQQYKQIIWQCNTNNERDANDLVLYRSYEGVAPEDWLLDKNKDVSEKGVYVPICSGVTYFSIDILTADRQEPIKAWPGGMPLGVTLTISFAKPYRDMDGHLNVPEDEKYSRTIALDKSRKIKFDMQKSGSPEGGIMTTDVNSSEAPDSTTKNVVQTKK